MKVTKLIVVFFFSLLISSNTVAQNTKIMVAADVEINADAAATHQYFLDFFMAYDSRDYERFESLLMPSAIFVSSNGSMSDIYQMQENMRVMAADESRSRELSDFEINRVGDVTIVGLSNHVIYKQNNRQYRDALFNETWILQNTASGLRLLRAHYTIILGE